MVDQPLSLSVVIPVHNEEENLRLLHDEITDALKGMAGNYEILFVDDGSTDASYETLLSIHEQDPTVRLLRFRHNEGQTAALREGMHHARGEVIITLDGDGQNDPCDIQRLLAKYEESKVDLLVGWRRQRHDKFWAKRLPSLLANSVLRTVLGTTVHDSGCTLKLFTRDLACRLPLADGFHRFIPALARRMGARIDEIEVHHRPRIRGRSKYGWERIFPVTRDILRITFFPLPGDRWRFTVVAVIGIVACRAFLGYSWLWSFVVPILLLVALTTGAWIWVRTEKSIPMADER